jgi:hypothetical protein
MVCFIVVLSTLNKKILDAHTSSFILVGSRREVYFYALLKS